MHGKTVLITGSTDGIGKQTAIELAGMGATVLVHTRDERSGAAAVREIRSEGGGKVVELYTADFMQQREVRHMAESVIAAHPTLDVLVNNAGVYMNTRVLTQDGVECTFAVNHIAAFLLTSLLLDLLRKSAPSRIITVTSAVHQNGSTAFQEALEGKDFSPYGAYATSKLANIQFTLALARRLSGTGVTANCLHPGVINTKLLKAGFSSTGKSLQEGAVTPVYLACSPDVAKVSGKYFVNRTVVRPSAQARDELMQERLWNLSERVAGLSPR